MSVQLYLASASPRRSELLTQMGVDHLILNVPASPGEDEPRHRNESPLVYVQRTAHVALGDRVLGKPADQEDARKTLSLLSNQTHLVHTAVVLCRGKERLAAISSSKVTFAALSALDIEQYIASKEPFGKAGAYGIQGLAAQYIRQLDGSYTGVMGLPLFETAQLLKQAGIL